METNMIGIKRKRLGEKYDKKIINQYLNFL